MGPFSVLGGAGGMGSRAVRDLAEQADVDKLVIADVNLYGAHQMAKKVNETSDTEAVAVHIDANLPETVVSAVKGCDAALRF